MMKKIKNLFNILIFLFFTTPFIFLLAAKIQSNFLEANLIELLQTNPSFNISFIIVFFIPFIGLFMRSLMKMPITKEESIEIIINLFFIMINLILLKKTIYSMGVITLIYLIFKQYNLSMKELTNEIKVFFINWRSNLSLLLMLIMSLFFRGMLIITG